jgi:Tol biopolymer transport system component
MTGPQPAPFRNDVSPSPVPALWKRAVLRWNSRYKQLERIVASNTLSPALAKFLHFIVIETIEGRADQLSEYVIAEKVFNQKEFAPSEKSVVRVEKRRLREKLKDYYEGAGKDDPVVISLGTNFVPIFSTRVNGVPHQPVQQLRPRWAWPVSIVGIAVAVALILWIVRKKPAEEFLLNRLTYDAGFTTDPAISPDGGLVAYASDRSGEGNLDIWVQNIGTGDRVRLAPNPADDYEPSFSPDGSKVVFRSDRAGGGIYTVAVLGGDLKLIANKGRGPRFSPDGQRIVYWAGESYFVRTQIYVVPATGGTPRAIHPDFYGAHDAVWSSNGKYLLFWGQKNESSSPDWWVAPLDGEPAIQTGAFPIFARENLAAMGPAAWVGDEVFFSATRDTTNLWKANLSPRTGKISGTPRRLTFGTDQDGEPSVAGNGSIVFSTVAANTNVWSLPVELNDGKVTGEILRVTRDLSTEVFPSISKNRRLAFSSDRSGKREIWVKDLAVNTNNKLAFSPSEFDSPKITPDGSKVAYAVSSPEWAIHIISATGGDERVYKKGGPPRDFSADGTKLLFEAKSCSPYCVGLLDLGQGTTRELIKDSRLALYPESFSPDSQWLAFQARPVDNDAARTIYVTPFRDGAAGGHEAWIPVTNGTEMDREVRWSPDGALLYFLSERDGFRCIWAQRLDRQTKQPAGAAFPVYHFHHSQQSLTSIGSPGKVGLSITNGALMFSLAETTGNIWMARRRR